MSTAMPIRSDSPRPKEGPTAPDPGSTDIPCLDSFRSELVTPMARAFVDWAATTAGPLVVLDRSRFEPSDVKARFGDISILQWDAEASDYRYRLFGSHWPITLGRDLTGQHLSVWPQKVARAIRDRVRMVVVRRIPVGAHVVMAHYSGDEVRRGHSVFEQVMWPLRYGLGSVGAVLVLSVRVPGEIGLNASSLMAAAGRHGVWFSADGEPLTPSPPVTNGE